MWIDSLDWTDLNALRRYPLREGLSAVSVDGLFSIPDDFIVDFSLSASSDVSRRFYVSKIFNKLTKVVIEISDNLNTVVGTFEVTASSHTQDDTYTMHASDAYVGANGRVTLGTFSSISRQPAGTYYFTLSTTEFEPRTIVPGIQGVDRIAFTDILSDTYTLTGDVKLLSRNNLRFSHDGNNNRVIFDAADNLGLNKQCAITNCVKMIDGVKPNPADGNLSLIGLNCLRVSSPAQYTLSFEDTCCIPCSGCDDLATLTTRLTSLENKFIELKGYYNAVDLQLSTYLSTINSNCSC